MRALGFCLTPRALRVSDSLQGGNGLRLRVPAMQKKKGKGILMESEKNKGKKKMPVIIEISDLDNVTGGVYQLSNVTHSLIVANRCPPVPDLSALLTRFGGGSIFA
jgi:hypothetical protein